MHLCYPENYAPHGGPDRIKEEPGRTTATTPWYLKYLPLRYIPGLRSLYYWLTKDLGQFPPQKPIASTSNPPRAIELGCAHGQYLATLRADGWDVVGIEPSEAASEKARQAGLQVYTSVLDDIELPPGTFDAAAAWMVIEHVINPPQTLRQLGRLLKPGGQLLISVPNAGCWETAVFRSSWYAWDLPRHLHHFTSSKISELLHEAGFVSIKVIHQRNIFYIIGSIAVWLCRIRLTQRIGQRLLKYPDAPRLWVQLLLSPLAHVLAFCRQGGRLTVTARWLAEISAACETADRPPSENRNGP